MEKKESKKEREARRHQEDQALNRGLIWAGGAIVLEFLLLILKHFYIDYPATEQGVNLAIAMASVLKAVRLVGPIAAVLGVVLAVLRLKKHEKAAVPVIIAVVGAVLAVCAHVALAFKAPGLQMLFLMVPVLAGLALVYYIYQKDFFLAALAGGLSVLGLWFVRYRGSFTMETVLVLVAVALVLALVLAVKKNNGVMPGTEFVLMAKDASYVPVLASCLAGLAALILAMVLGTTAAYYLIFLMVAWLFVLLVYYTVKLM